MADNKIWTPTKRQEDFISIPDTIFEGFFGGSAGPGKSECLMMLPIIREFYKIPGFKGILFRRTFPELEREIIPRSQEYFKLTGARYNDSKKRWTWDMYNTMMQFGYAEYEKDARSYDTTEYNYMAFDELTSFTEFQYTYLSFSRCRTSNPRLPAIVRSASNPGNVGHGFCRKRFVEPARGGYKIIQQTVMVGGKPRVIKRIFIPAKALDNPHIDPDYIVRLQMLPEAERLAKAEGDWWTFSGQVFEDWRLEPFRDEPDNARHVVKPFDIPPWWPRVLAIDWGYSAMMCALWAAINPATKRIYIYREYTAIKTKISSWAKTLAALSAGENLVDVVLDPSAWGNRGDECTIAEQFSNLSGMNPRRADNDRISGKNLVQEALRWEPVINPFYGHEPDVGHAMEIYEFHGEATYHRYMDQFTDEPETAVNLPKLQVFDTAVKLIETIPLCVYNDPTMTRKGSPEDVAEFNGDDPYDTVRYILKACQYYLDVGGAENERQSKIAGAMDLIKTGQDQTAFYMQMDRIDAEHQRIGMGVKKFHHAQRRKYRMV